MEIFISAFSQIFNSTCSGWAGCNTDSALNQSLVDCKRLGCIKMCLLIILRQTKKHLINSFIKFIGFVHHILWIVLLWSAPLHITQSRPVKATVKSIIYQKLFYSTRLTNSKKCICTYQNTFKLWRMDRKYLHIKWLPRDHNFMNLRLLWSV